MTLLKEIRLPNLLSLIRQYEFPKKLGLLELFFGKRLSTHGICWVNCWNGVTWKLDLTDPCHRWIVFGKYEGGEGIDYACLKLKNGGVFVDSGSNIGQWSLYLSKIDKVTTMAFEPVDSQRAWLKECLGFQHNWDYKIFECGLGSKEDTVEILCDGARSTLRMDWYSEKKFNRQDIKLKKLDEILKSHRVDKVTFWKLDVEGAELNALIGAKSYLLDKKIENIYFECHPSNYADIRRFLEGCGYRLYYLNGGQLLSKKDHKISSTEDLVALPLK